MDCSGCNETIDDVKTAKTGSKYVVCANCKQEDGRSLCTFSEAKPAKQGKFQSPHKAAQFTAGSTPPTKTVGGKCESCLTPKQVMALMLRLEDLEKNQELHSTAIAKLNALTQEDPSGSP